MPPKKDKNVQSGKSAQEAQEKGCFGGSRQSEFASRFDSDEAEFVFEPKAKAKTDIASPGRLPVKFDALPFMDEPAGGVAFEV
ncbi:MAG: hypothetical protein ISN28_07585 [Ectothiorhodospiraceae bacterium AqS1]|nr:hypothetical protein [Ectothiorhodospiraceae bacterium AqS1]